jgi:CRISPR/Cas system-associated exonuclease Cas4 (RecB family)
MDDDDYISASDIGKFAYCQRAWWLRLNGVITPPTPAMQQGDLQHEALAEDLRGTTRQARSGAVLVWVGLGLALLIVALRLLSGGG